MVINTLYRKYFQKSKIFIYPLLDIKRGTTIVPTETYLSWGDMLSTEDMKLICVYENESTDEYLKFEKEVLLKHTRLCDYTKIDDKTTVFTFDFSDLGDDWFHLINGAYSKLSLEIKRKIVSFFDKNSGNYVYVNSYIFPEKHFKRYAEILDVSENMLKEVGELCDKPDLIKENLTISVANLQEIKNSSVTL